MLGCGTVQVATAAMLDKAIGPNVIRDLTEGMSAFLEKHELTAAGIRSRTSAGCAGMPSWRNRRSRARERPDADPDDPAEGYAR